MIAAPAWSRTTRPRRTARTASRTWRSWSTPRAAFVREAELAADAPMLSERVAADATPTAARRRPRGRHRSARRVPRARRARGRREAGGGGPRRAAADDRALGQGPGVPHGVRHRARGRPVPAREQPVNEFDGLEEERRLMYVAITRAQAAALPDARAEPDAARADALQHRVALPRRAAARAGAVAVAAAARDRASTNASRGRFAGAAGADAAGDGAGAQRRRAAAGPAWRIGQSVRHAKFGTGVIIDAEGRGADARVQVNFRDAGAKWLPRVRRD